MATEGAVGRQHQLTQQPGGAEGRIQLHQPSLAAFIGFRNGQIAEAVDGGHRQIEIDRAVAQALLAQLLGQSNQLLQEGQLILERLEGGRCGAGLGLALGEGLQCRLVDHAVGADGAAGEAVVLQNSIGAEVQGHGEGSGAAAQREGRRLAQAGRQQRQPGAAHTEGLALLPQVLIEGAAEADPFGHGRGVYPQAQAVVEAFQRDRGQDRCLGAIPALQQQGRQGGEIVAVLAVQRFGNGLGRCRPVAQVVLGEQQIKIGLRTRIHRQTARHMALGGQLSHGEAIHLHLHHGLLGGLQVLGIAGGELHRREQPVVEGHGHQPFVLLLHMGQQAGGAALEDALHAAFG